MAVLLNVTKDIAVRVLAMDSGKTMYEQYCMVMLPVSCSAEVKQLLTS